MKSLRNFYHYKLRNLIVGAKTNTFKYQVEDSITIFSAPRSGSTWLMDVISQIPGTAVNWEPENDKYGVLDPELGLRYDIKYIDPDRRWEAANSEFRRILTGRKLNRWTTRQSSMAKWMTSKILITKFVRANALLPWLLNQFDFRYKPILLIRHPLAVVKSQLKNFKKEDYDIDIRFSDGQFEEYREFVEEHDSPLERLTIFWCINNIVALNQLNSDKVLKFYYEEMLLNPKEHFIKIFKELGFTPPVNLEELVMNPSSSDFQSDFDSDVRKQLEKWVEKTDRSEIETIQNILNYFEINEYKADEPYPIASMLSKN